MQLGKKPLMFLNFSQVSFLQNLGFTQELEILYEKQMDC